MTLTQKSILEKARVGHIVWPLSDGRVAVSGSRAVTAARQLADAGLVSYQSHSERVQVRSNDGWRSEYVLLGTVTVL